MSEQQRKLRDDLRSVGGFMDFAILEANAAYLRAVVDDAALLGRILAAYGTRIGDLEAAAHRRPGLF